MGCMKDSELEFDRSVHVIYSGRCREILRTLIEKHYGKERLEEVWEKVQKQYVSFLSGYRTDLGGKKNFHNGECGTYDCIAFFSYWKVCRDVTSFEEIEKAYGDLFLPSFAKLSFVDCNRPVFMRLLNTAFRISAGKCAKWKDYDMRVEPYRKGEPVRYRFYSCPVAEFAREHNLLDILPALCNADYAGMELIHARLVRTKTCGKDDYCDYTICGDRHPYLCGHEEYRDGNGGRWNR